MKKHSQSLRLGVLISFLFLGACAIPPEAQQASTATVSEASFCSSVRTFTPSVALTSQAQFYARQVKKTLSQQGLYGPTAPQDIKYAEVAILDSNGAEVQCGMTDVNGNINIAVPKVAGSYSLVVRSRADSNYYKASVLNAPQTNVPYSISASFTLTGAENNKSVTLPIASYNGNLEGAAFNILNQVYRANEYLRNNSASCPACTTFTVAPKAAIYWKAGMSPLAYFDEPTESLSFFLNGDAYGLKKGIYIQGGIEGDVNCSDTDHFDNSVIIHEYGHFLEDAFSRSDSPGGSHNGNFIIDPRLAWSEGWANFFQAAVTGTNYYRDTDGNEDCAGSTFLRVDLDMEQSPGVNDQDYMGPSTVAGEGVFREVSVSRALYDMITSSVGGDSIGVGLNFSWLWYIFSDGSIGFRNSSVHYRNIGRFNQLLRTQLVTHASSDVPNFDNVVSNEYQLATTREYAYPVTASGGACTFLITGTNDMTYQDGSVRSNQFASNDFFQLYYNGSSSLSVSLKYAATGGGSPSDLDLFVYKEGYVYGNSNYQISASARTSPEANPNYIETVSFSGRPAGYYLINVKVKGNRPKAETEYYLETNTGVRLCP